MDKDEEAKIDTGNGKKRKLSNMEETPLKRRLDPVNTEIEVEENGELPNFNLPSELLVKIIDMVPISQWASLELVSLQFQGVVQGLWGHVHEIRLNELAYNEKKKKADPCEIMESILEKFLIRAPKVASISGFDDFFNRSTPIRLETIQLLSKFEHLESIDFSGQPVITVSNLALLLKSSASRQCWKTLNVADGVYGSIMSHDRFGKQENQSILTLECFKLNVYMLEIFDGFPQIEWSQLRKLVVVDSFSCTKEVLLIIRQCIQVTHLEIKIPHPDDNPYGPSYYGHLMQAVADLENLSVLKIMGYDGSWYNALHDALLVLIQDLGRRRITDFALVQCYCTNRIIDAIIDYLPRLKSLELEVTFWSTTSLERLVTRMSQLESLNFKLKCSYEADSTVVRAICDNMQELQCLHLSYLDCNSESLTSLVDLRNLKELRITGRRIEWRAIEALARRGFGSCLETLELAFENGIPPEHLVVFLKNMPRLRRMELVNISDSILYAISESCPNLIDLNVEWSKITSTGIQSVIDRCSQLKFVKVIDIIRKNEWFPASLTVGKYRKVTFKSKVDE